MMPSSVEFIRFLFSDSTKAGQGYFLWGPESCTGKVVISISVSSKRLQATFSSITQIGINKCQYCTPWVNNLPIYIARDPKVSMRDIWLKLKNYS